MRDYGNCLALGMPLGRRSWSWALLLCRRLLRLKRGKPLLQAGNPVAQVGDVIPYVCHDILSVLAAPTSEAYGNYPLRAILNRPLEPPPINEAAMEHDGDYVLQNSRMQAGREGV